MTSTIWGSFFGNLAGTLCFLSFQIAGLLLAAFFLKDFSRVTRLLCGSVLGTVLFQWLPLLFAFFLDFSVPAHLAAMFLCAGFILLLFTLKVPHASFFPVTGSEIKAFAKKHRLFLLLLSITFLVFCLMLSSHTLAVKEDGLHTGQCTYGDMNLHLGIITSIARQQEIPPEYSISPGDKLSYPFLCDSISSSIYIWGASLRYSYILPMLLAILQVMAGFYCLAYEWLKKTSKACLAWFLFFYNGGLGFLYFIDWSAERTYTLRNIFTGFYETPANLIQNNIRWVNVLVDMLLPQRATLFGYALLFPCIWLLFRAVWQGEKKLFFPIALLAGAMPMVHTHSFLCMAFISAAWLLMQLYTQHKQTALLLQEAPSGQSALQKQSAPAHPFRWVPAVFLVFMCLLQALQKTGIVLPSRYIGICLLVFGILLLPCCRYLLSAVKKDGFLPLLRTWGLYLIIVLLLALPQLCYWTFGQTANEGFLTGHFNWGNQGDGYLWFYCKNWGIILLLLIPALWNSSLKNFSVISAGFFIWFAAELISFSPNTYDNNKLLYIAYALFCCISADYGIRLYQQLKGFGGAKFFASLFLFLSCISALLSMGRELVSDYTLYSNAHIEAALYVDGHTAPDATVLTNSRHVNEISSLAGRNIVNGADIFLWPHGLYQKQRTDDVRLMYENPNAAQALFEKYSVDYIMISSWERNEYQIDEGLFDSLYPCVFQFDEVKIYQLKDHKTI